MYVYNPEVSVIIISYNPVWEKFENTLLSVVMQKRITMEIILSDDGSAQNLFHEAECLLRQAS